LARSRARIVQPPSRRTLMTSPIGPRNAAACALLSFALIVLLPLPGATTRAAGAGPVGPNYELASQWATTKIGKAGFDTGVTPHWLQTTGRFWFSFETRRGKRYFVGDPVKRPKQPLFDKAKMGARLAEATRVPMDAQHLPIKTLKAIKSDAALRIEVEVPKTAEIPGLKKAPAKTTTTAGDKQGDPLDEDSDLEPQQRR